MAKLNFNAADYLSEKQFRYMSGESSFDKFSSPENFILNDETIKYKTEPRLYQRQAVQKLIDKEAGALFLDMGTGKTKVALDILYNDYLANKIKGALIICPLTIQFNWKLEIQKHFGTETFNFHSFKSGKKKAYAEWLETINEDFTFLTVGVQSLSSENVCYLIEFFTEKIKDYAVICDESAFIKNIEAKRTKHSIELAEKASRRLIMTGTPILNRGLEDLYAQFYFLNWRIIGEPSLDLFQNKYVIYDYDFNFPRIAGFKNEDILFAKTEPYLFRGKKEDLLPQLPKKTYQELRIDPTPELKKAYNAYVLDFQKIYEEAERENKGKEALSNIMRTQMCRLRQVCGGFKPPLFGNDRAIPLKRNPKIEELLSIIENISENDSIVIWAQYIDEIEMIVSSLQEKFGYSSVVELYGKISNIDREKNIEKFQNGESRFIVGNVETGGVGLNLQRGNVVIYFSNGFSFGNRQQSEDRVHRLGQEKPVLYIDLLLNDTIDENILYFLKKKLNFAEHVDFQMLAKKCNGKQER